MFGAFNTPLELRAQRIFSFSYHTKQPRRTMSIHTQSYDAEVTSPRSTHQRFPNQCLFPYPCADRDTQRPLGNSADLKREKSAPCSLGLIPCRHLQSARKGAQLGKLNPISLCPVPLPTSRASRVPIHRRINPAYYNLLFLIQRRLSAKLSTNFKRFLIRFQQIQTCRPKRKSADPDIKRSSGRNFITTSFPLSGSTATTP